MAIMILGIALFWIAHGLKIHAPAKRAELAARMGEGPVKGLTTLALVASIVLIVIGYQQAAFINIWFPPAFLTHLNNLLMVIAVTVFIAGSFKGLVADKIRHPQLAGMKIWTVAHLLVNGDLASIILFGSMLAWAVVAMIALNKRDGKPARAPKATLKGNLFHAGATVVVFAVIVTLHGLAGVSPFPGGGA